MQGHAPLAQVGEHRRQELLGRRLVHEQRLGRVAHRRAGDLGIDGDGRRHLHIGVLIDIDMTVAGAGLDDRDGGVLYHRADQAGAAPGDEHVEVFVHPHHGRGGFPGGIFEKLHRVGGQSPGREAFPDGRRDGDIGADRLFAPSEKHGVPRF